MKKTLKILGLSILSLWLLVEIIGVVGYTYNNNMVSDFYISDIYYRPFILKVSYVLIPSLKNHIEPYFYGNELCVTCTIN